MEELKKYLQQEMNQVQGLRAIFITDRDGVPVYTVADDNFPDIRPKFFSTTGLSLEQASKLGLGASKHVIAIYEHFQVVTFNQAPVMIVMVATVEANTGMMIKIAEDIKRTCPELKHACEI